MTDFDSKPRRLILLFDGTWNRREDTTNVWRMRLMLRRSADQVVFYDEGVGTIKGEAIRGGAFGMGLSRKVLAGYLWLMENYEDAKESPRGVADQVFIFGFSRGAFTARSLAGLLNLFGLLRKDSTRRVIEVFKASREGWLNRDDDTARDFRRNYGREVSIELLGVWDTVGALGDPRIIGSIFENENAHKAKELPSIVKHAVHALAVDEHREKYKPTLWPQETSRDQFMEQRWFVGAHSNVGGGYDRDGLFLRPLQWIQGHALRLGLEFGVRIAALGDLFDTSFPRKSLNEMAGGLYRAALQWKSFNRPVSLGSLTNETIDYTVIEKWIWSTAYRPPSLENLLGNIPDDRAPARHLSDQHILDLLRFTRKNWAQARMPNGINHEGDPCARGFSLKL